MGIRMNMFRTPKHRKYDYVPRYFDPEKEERELRFKKKQVLAQDDPEGMKARIRSQMKRGASGAYASERRRLVFRQNLILFGVLAILVCGTLYFINVYLPEIVQMFEPVTPIDNEG